MAQVKGPNAMQLYFNEKQGHYEIYSAKGERIDYTTGISITNPLNDLVTANISLVVNIVNERPQLLNE